MATDNETNLALTASNRKNLAYKERTAKADAEVDLLNSRLSDDGTDDGTPDSATDAAVTAIKVQTAIIDGRIDVLFPLVKPDGFPTPVIIAAVVEDAADTIIVLTYNVAVALTDETGFTVSGSAAATTISSAAVQTNKSIVHLTANGSVIDTETVLLSYSAGNVISVDDGDSAVDQTDFEVTNNVVA